MENRRLAKRLNIGAWVLTALVLALVVLMREVKIEVAFDTSFLPAFNASVNSLTSIVLLYAFIQIKRKHIENHRKAMYAAVGLSVIFLFSYVLYHFSNVETPYCGHGASKTVYLVILASHIILAAIIFPFIMFTFVRAYTGQFAKHRKMAKWVWPVWFYVTVTGPVVYLMLRPCYAF